MMDELRSQLKGRIYRFTEKEPVVHLIRGLKLIRSDHPTEPASYLMPPSICLVVQGAKRVLLGKEVYVYDSEKFLLTSVDLSVTAQIIEASQEKPYLGITWGIDLDTLRELIIELDVSQKMDQTSRGMVLGRVTPQILDAFRRLIELLDEPDHLSVLSRLIQKELIYRLLMSEVGPRLIQIALPGSHGYQITLAVEYLKKHFSKPIRVKELAELGRMSTSSFYQHFKALTGMTPLQYQKKLRLCEARKLILSGLDVTTAASQVGYNSLSQFSREYKRFFGVQPSQDAKNFQQNVYSEISY
ncbi:AraC family transcriptional regulator [Methermicoccus shengliensis]|nr:AraC family transcriptional regulator [Methermicoccus shengliensis]KUK29663.1 MAG: Transcriptional regulator, AraC family [Methanosarcinales archeaon 56_1174]